MSNGDPVRMVLDLLKETFGATFKEYYDGDPDAIPLFNLPAVIVDQTGDETVGGAFMQDDVTDRIVVKIVLNKRDDFDGNLVKPLNTTARKVRDIIGRIDPETGTYAEKTVKHVLRTKIFNEITLLSDSLTVDYGVSPRPPMEGYADLTQEGHVSFGLTYSRETN